jgi:predicted transcriptional regulator
MDWTIDDDRVLVETVLAKLQLSKRTWNDCARRLGKDKDSLGRRWRLLVDEGNVGLKRGGRIRRTDLEIDSW